VSEPLRARIEQMLRAHGVATLATSGPEGPWAAAVFYASDQDLNLVFVTDPGTRHGRDLAAGGRAAAAIHAQASGWSEIRGLQIEGAVRQVAAAGRPAALAIYLEKFPEIRRVSEAPRDDAERGLQRRLASIALWRLAPAMIRVIDNRERFGWKQELRLTAPG